MLRRTSRHRRPSTEAVAHAIPARQPEHVRVWDNHALYAVSPGALCEVVTVISPPAVGVRHRSARAGEPVPLS
ncbi:hypothetical protein GCM10010498_23910 [Streptomyces cavourensis]|nr:hypothetical protein GCM10010498_23910 [Streptomyces cavourensis]